MKALKIDETGDFVIENGSFVVIEGDEQLAQEVRISIETLQGEWFLNPDEGMEREPFLGKKFNENNARSSIIEAVMNVSEPLKVEQITFTTIERVLYVDIALRKEDGGTFLVEGVRI